MKNNKIHWEKINFDMRLSSNIKREIKKNFKKSKESWKIKYMTEKSYKSWLKSMISLTTNFINLTNINIIKKILKDILTLMISWKTLMPSKILWFIKTLSVKMILIIIGKPIHKLVQQVLIRVLIQGDFL